MRVGVARLRSFGFRPRVRTFSDLIATPKFVNESQLDELRQQCRKTVAHINLDSVNVNLQSLHRCTHDQLNRSLDKNTKDEEKLSIIPIVKANGYGHGALFVTLEAITQKKVPVSHVAVATLEEAVSLREQLKSLNIFFPILLLGVSPRGAAEIMAKFEITPTVSSIHALQEFAKVARESKKKLKIHIKKDTGMHRVGLLEDQVPPFLEELNKILQDGWLDVEGIYTHLSKADETDKAYTIKQLQSFDSFIDSVEQLNVKPKLIHCMNSAGIIDFHLLKENNINYAKYNYFRAGISLYGLYPSDEVDMSPTLHPLMHWTSEIAQLKHLQAGDLIGYGGIYRVEKPMSIAVLPVGYADGYRRLLGSMTNKVIPTFQVRIKDQLCSIVGRVCMDLIMVDVTAISNVKEGDTVTLMGGNPSPSDPLHCDKMANYLQTINYEVTCLVGHRVPRFFYKKNQFVGMQNLYGSFVLENAFNF